MPMFVLQELFRQQGFEVSLAEVRHMGLLKKDHIRAILDEPRVAGAWDAHHGQRPIEQDVERTVREVCSTADRGHIACGFTRRNL